MIINGLNGAPDMEDILVFDRIEDEWRIGHKRVLYVGEEFICACTVREANDYVADGAPVPVFAEALCWAALPVKPEWT